MIVFILKNENVILFRKKLVRLQIHHFGILKEFRLLIPIIGLNYTFCNILSKFLHENSKKKLSGLMIREILFHRFIPIIEEVK